MIKTRLDEGTLKIMVSSEGNTIYAGTQVAIFGVEDNFKNMHILVQSAFTAVRLPVWDTKINWLI